MSGYKRSVIAGMAAFMLFLNMGISAFGAPIGGEAAGVVVSEEPLTPEEQEEKEYQEELQKSYNLPVQSNKLTDWPAGPATYGTAGIVMDIESGAILYAKNMDEQRYPASITKLLTTLIALENGKFDDRLEVTEDCVSFLEWDYAQIGLKVGENISLKEALYATLLESANEAAYAIAANVGESYEWFIGEMNRRAKELGALDSHFVNANGLHDDNHYTTAHDMALISAALYDYPEVFQIMQTLDYQMAPTDMYEETRNLTQNHVMLDSEAEQYYQYAIGGKTGYTGEALNTLVTYADNGNLHLVCVELGTLSGMIWGDTQEMLDYAFDNFQKVSIPPPGESGEFESVEDDGYVVLPTGIEFSALESEVQENEDETGKGTVTYSYEDQVVGTAQVVLTKPEVAKQPDTVTETAEKIPAKGNEKIPLKTIVAFSGSVVLIILILLARYYFHRRKNKVKHLL